MTFDITNFGKLDSNQSQGLPQEWGYTTTDTSATVDTAGYFNDAVNILNVGDVIKAKTSTGGTTEFNEFYVSQNDGTTVDVNDAVSYSTSTDTD